TRNRRILFASLKALQRHLLLGGVEHNAHCAAVAHQVLQLFFHDDDAGCYSVSNPSDLWLSTLGVQGHPNLAARQYRKQADDMVDTVRGADAHPGLKL